MKTFPVPFLVSARVTRTSAVALLSLALGLTASAQTSNGTGTDTSGTGSTSGSTSGSMSGSGSTSSSGAYGTAGRRSTARDDQSSLKHSDQRFLTKAAESSEREVALSQLAAQRATNPQVRDFAQQLVSQHEQMNQQLIQLASRKGVTLEGDRAGGMAVSAGIESTAGANNASGVASNSDTTRRSGSNTGLTGTGDRPASSASVGSASMASEATGAASDRHYRSLSKKTGADFDKEYVSLMVSEHKSDVKLFEKAAKDAKDPEVRTFASQHVAALQTHLDHAKTLDKSVAE